MAGGNQDGSESNAGARIAATSGSADRTAAPDGSLCAKDHINLSQDTLARLQSVTAARAASADAGASLVHQEGNAGNAPSSSNPIASTIAEGIIAGTIDTAAASSARADLNGSSRAHHAETVTLPLVNPSGTAQLPQSFARSLMTAQHHGASTSADQQPAAAQAWYNAVLAAGHTPDALASILSLINAEAARGLHTASQPMQPDSAPAPPATRPPPPEAHGNMAATPLSAKLRQILQAGAMKQEPPKDPPVQKHIMSQPQQVTTGDMQAHLHPSIRAHVNLPDPTPPAGAKTGPPSRSDPTPHAWPLPTDTVQPSSQLPQQSSAKSGSEVLKRTFEARPESPSKRLRFQGGIAELQQELSRRALEGGLASSLPQEAFPAAAEADARTRRLRSHDLQAKDLTDMVRRDAAPVPRTESSFLKHLMDSIPREGSAAAGASDAAIAWPMQPAERSRSGFSRMLQPPPAAAPAPAPAPASAASPPRLSATQHLQKSLISELTGQAPRRLLDQLDPGTLGLILTTGGAPPAPAPGLPSVPAGALASTPADPLASHALQMLQRPAPPEPAPHATASRPVESPLSPHTAEQLYMRLENAIGAPAAAALISGQAQKPAAQPVQPLKPLASPPQPQLLDMLQAFIAPGSALPPLHMRRDTAAPHVGTDPARDSQAAAQALASRPPLAVTLPTPSHAQRSAPATSFVPTAQPSRRKQSPQLSLCADRSAGLRAPRAVDAAALPHFGAPQLLTSSDLAKPAAPLLALGAVDLRSGPAASLATPLQQPKPPPPAAAAAPGRQPPPAAPAVDPSVSSIIEALTGSGPMSPHMRQRTLAAIGQYISEQGQATAERGSAAASVPDAPASAAAPAPAHTPPPEASKAPATAVPPPDGAAAAQPAPGPAPKMALSMTDDELQAAELLMALSGAAAPASAPPPAPRTAPAPAAAAADPKPSPRPPTPAPAPAPPIDTAAPAAVLMPAAMLSTSAAAPAPGRPRGELGSPAAEVLRQQMMSMLGMAEPPVPPSPSQGGAARPQGGAADATTAARPLQPAAVPLAPASAAAPPPADVAAGQGGSGTAEAAAADLLSAYQVDSWRVDGNRRGAPGPGR